MKKEFIIVRGGGDLASGTIYKLVKCHYKVLVLEIEKPSSIRRNVSFSEAIYDGKKTIEGVTCYKAEDLSQAKELLLKHDLVIMIDPNGQAIKELKPRIVVDAILAKMNLGTHRQMAPITIALGPGFQAPEDVNAVIETKRGHHLGRVIEQGEAIKNTGVPGVIAGVSKDRVIHAPSEGILYNVSKVTDTVKKGQVIAYIENDHQRTDVLATIDGLLRGLIRDGYPVTKGFKIADIDPRINEYDNCFTISDKARCIAGGVIEAILHLSGESL